jgi:hypothetical protein
MNKPLAQKIYESKSSRDVVPALLKTDEKVISRVTDGIYRQPGSALRELVSNAYDADATRVVIKTDAPRFERITIEDNGHGMTPGALAHLIEHIGGSAKRSREGASLGVTSEDNVNYSPKGRRLIGKIGIGLFSVSQLTRSFQIITKVKGEKYRTVATVSLKQYSDSIEVSDEASHESGKVNIWREPASDVDSHGTLIVLTKIRPQARDTLRSREIWAAIEQADREAAESGQSGSDIKGPNFHVGRVDVESGALVQGDNEFFKNVPWELKDSSDVAFRKLVDCVWGEVKLGNPSPKLSRIFDYYLQMVWQLALSVPLPYIGDHIFDTVVDDPDYFYFISNDPKNGKARKLSDSKGKELRESLGLVDGLKKCDKFDVYFDDLKLSRPIKFSDLPNTSHAIKRPMIFVGKCEEVFDGVPIEISGGSLSFEAYLFWNPKIAPTEHRGSLVRVHGASGTLFDSHFMHYQVSELTRLNQITCEIFVHEGLDGALNIDRESFNSAHPHAVYLTRWLHGALRQLATAQKRLGSEIRDSARERVRETTLSRIKAIATDEWQRVSGDTASSPPDFVFQESEQSDIFNQPDTEHYSFMASEVFVNREEGVKKKVDPILQAKVEAIGQVIASYGMFESVSKSQQSSLLKSIYQVLASE